MRRTHSGPISFCALLLVLLLVPSSAAARCGNGVIDGGETEFDCPRDVLVERVAILKEGAARGAWSPGGGEIAFDYVGDDGFYDVAIMRRSGQDIRPLTRDHDRSGDRHKGWPVWHPTGRMIVFQAEAPEHFGAGNEKLKALGNPGLGLFNNLWAITPDGRYSWQLTDIPIKTSLFDRTPAMGIVNPIFSRDGKRMAWTMRVAGGGYLDWGQWEIHVADIVYKGGQVALDKKRVLIRARDICRRCNYVNAMGFFPGNRRLLLSGNLDGQHVYGLDLYIYDIATGRRQNLLRSPRSWEEGSCISPDGRKVVYQTNIESPFTYDFDDKNWHSQPVTREWWILDLPTMTKQRLTYFNEPASPEYGTIGKGRRVITAKCSFSPDGTALIGIVGIDHALPAGQRVDMRLNLALVTFR